MRRCPHNPKKYQWFLVADELHKACRSSLPFNTSGACLTDMENFLEKYVIRAAIVDKTV